MFKVAILQKRSINEQIDKNIETIIMAMEEASENHADILLLPECFITGYDLPMSYEKSIADNDIRMLDVPAHIVQFAGIEMENVLITQFCWLMIKLREFFMRSLIWKLLENTGIGKC